MVRTPKSPSRSHRHFASRIRPEEQGGDRPAEFGPLDGSGSRRVDRRDRFDAEAFGPSAAPGTPGIDAVTAFVDTTAAELVDATGDAAVVEDSATLKHNLCIFRGGADASRILTPLLDSVPEARLNLTIHYLKAGDIAAAHATAEGIKPVAPTEYIVKAVVHAELGQASGDREHLRLAQQYFQLGETAPPPRCAAM